MTSETLNVFGLPGYVDMPSGGVLDDGDLALTTSNLGHSQRTTLSFQLAPRLTVAMRYSHVGDYFPDGDLWDRSFDLHFQIAEERGMRPAIAVGLRDIAGTGIYSSEYVAATKTFGSGFEVTAGLGWGRLAGRDPIGAPLGFLGESFETRPDVREGNIRTTGQFDADAWFRGDAALFAGMAWRPSDRWTLTAEYSSDLYTLESARDLVEVTSPFNFGASYRFANGAELGAYSVHGTELGLRLSYVLDPSRPARPGGREGGPPAIQPRDAVAAASWTGAGGDALTARVQQGLADEGIVLEGLTVSGGTAHLRMRNTRWPAAPQAAGRAARVLANTLPPHVERFRVTFVQTGMPVSTVEMVRSDLETLEYALEGDWQMYARSTVTDAAGAGRSGEPDDLYPAFGYSITPYVSELLFDPDQPVRADIGVQVAAAYTPGPGTILSGSLRKPLFGTLDDQERESNSVLPRVRSDVGSITRNPTPRSRI